ncbi:MAG: type I DNA topoisomerase [Mucinivorans sp.]
MQSNLVIVESPAKAKTIEKILGADFLVKSSFGHIRDLDKKGISIDIEAGFEPTYMVSEDKKKVVEELQRLAKSAKMVWLASDEDREGEAIAWHLEQTLNLEAEKTKRIVFHEITKNAILTAVDHPRDIDHALVDAQQARRVLDRLVGFELSPLLWKKVKPSLSAGRVQSVVVKLIVEREREIMGFNSLPYWRVTAEFATPSGEIIKAELKDRFQSEKQASDFLSALSGSDVAFKVIDVTTTPSKRIPAPPFTTSTLQQEASRKLGFSVSQTMSVAQKLYEAGLITYMRTDSVNLSAVATSAAQETIVSTFGEQYYKFRHYTTKSKGAQEAHEAIRPTEMRRSSAGATPTEKRLYELIWKRTMATQMADAQTEKTVISIEISNRSERFVTQGEVIKFDGFLRLYIESHDDETESEQQGILPRVNSGDALHYQVVDVTEKFTQRPSRYSEASLVKQLEELGIGRPSTYAPTISTVITRGYVVKENRDGGVREFSVMTLAKTGKIVRKVKTENFGSEKQKLFPTDIGMVVTDFLELNFPEVLDYNFTANVELQFDKIADGELGWRKMLGDFYTPFHSNIVKANESSDYARSERVIGLDPASGKTVMARVGRYGPMVQIGEAEDKRFASLGKGQLIESITLEQALSLFALPRVAGSYEEKDMVVAIGRFGPYVRHNSIFTSLDKSDDPYTISCERCIELIEAKREKERNRVIHNFELQGLQVLNGRWGAYISYNEKNYRIPKTIDAALLTLESAMSLVDEGEKNGTATVQKKKVAPVKKSVKVAKPAKKSTTTKKIAVKKTVVKK